jgi:hypothetical protein
MQPQERTSVNNLAAEVLGESQADALAVRPDRRRIDLDRKCPHEELPPACFAAFRSKAEPESNYSSTSHCVATTMSFALVRGDAAGYANPQLLMQADSPDRGRDISCERVFSDTLSGTRNQRVIIQAKHWLSKPVRVSDVSETVSQVAQWEPPKVHVLRCSRTATWN